MILNAYDAPSQDLLDQLATATGVAYDNAIVQNNAQVPILLFIGLLLLARA